MTNFSKTQKKKIWYTLLAIFTVGLFVGVSFLLWYNVDWNQDWSVLSTKIITAITSYGSLAFLLLKIVLFFIAEWKKKQDKLKLGDTNMSILKKKKTTESTVATTSTTTTTDNRSVLKTLNKEFSTNDFTFTIEKGSTVTIEVTGEVANSKQLYEKLNYQVGQFLELLRKYTNNEID